MGAARGGGARMVRHRQTCMMKLFIRSVEVRKSSLTLAAAFLLAAAASADTTAVPSHPFNHVSYF